MSGYAGSGVAFLTSPYISGANVTAKDVENRNSLSKEFVGELQTGIQNVVYFGAAIATVSFLMIVIYFPPRPPTPPSRSQTREREDFWSGIKHLLQNGHFWLLNIAFNLPNGTFNAWIPLCSVNFRSLGVDEVTAGWVGFTSMISSVIGSVVMSAVIDRMKRRMKLSCIILGTLSLVILAILVCIQEHYIYVPKEAVTAVVYVLCISASLCINGAIPIYYEMGCELAFPVHEGLTCSLLTLTNNLFGMMFFLIFLVPSLAANTEWMTWVCVGTCGLTTPLLLFMKERFSRLDIEDSGRSSPSVTIET
ncbi:DIRC2 [Bugula neritina]|uniref:DIRC2 n=1 Tax=Bugula neritina TaxID=10212 RepID=A0A7J7KGP4_BUGNE|nr:DIRC2 [Bugula neritina]